MDSNFAPDAPRAAVQPPREPAERVSWPTPAQAPSPAQFGTTATLPPNVAEPTSSTEATIDLTARRPTSSSDTPPLSRASFGWRPDEKPATEAKTSKPGKAAKAAKAPKPPKAAKAPKPAGPVKATKTPPPEGLKKPISTRSALITILGVALIIGGGVAFWLGQSSDTTEPTTASPLPSTPIVTEPPPFSAPAPSVVAPTVPASFPDTLAGQAAEFERSIGPAGMTNLAAYRSALTAFGDAIPLENGDPATYGVRVQTTATDVFNAAAAVIGSLQTASVGPLVQPYVDDLRRTLGQVSASSNIVAACDPTQPCGSDILTARNYQSDAYLAATVLDGLTP